MISTPRAPAGRRDGWVDGKLRAEALLGQGRLVEVPERVEPGRECGCRLRGGGGCHDECAEQNEKADEGDHFRPDPNAARRARARPSAASIATLRRRRSSSGGEAGAATGAPGRAMRKLRAAFRSSAARASSPLHARPADTMAMQSTGQGGKHSLHPVHSAGSTVCMCFAAPRMASYGQASMHNVQPMHVASSIRATANACKVGVLTPWILPSFGVAMGATAGRDSEHRRKRSHPPPGRLFALSLPALVAQAKAAR